MGWGFRLLEKGNDNGAIEAENKFQYLLRSMIVGSGLITKELIVASFPPSGENYFKAIDHLKARFGRDALFIDA